MRTSFNGLNTRAEDIVHLGIILCAGIGLGSLSTQYSQLLSFAGTAIFTFCSVALYASSFSRQKFTVEETAPSVVSHNNPLLFHFFHLSFFLSITIPKSGRTVSGIPFTTANICILLTLILWASKLIFSRNPNQRIYFSKSLLVFISYGIIASVLGFLNGNSYKYILLDLIAFIGFIPVYFLVCSVCTTRRQLQKIVFTITISMALVCIYGILQPRLGFDRIAIPGLTKQYNMATYVGVGKWNVIEGGAQKVYSTFQNGNIFGNHLALFIPFLGGILLGMSSASSKKKFFLTGIFMLSCYTLLITYSRGALVSTIGGIMFLALIAKKVRLKALAIIIIVMTIFLIFIQYYGDRPELTRYDFRRIQEDPNRFSAGRIFRVKFVLSYFSAFSIVEKLFGRGFGAGLVTPHISDYTDNLYLTLLFKFGIVGLLLLFGLFFRFFQLLIYFYAKTTDEQLKGIIAGGTAGIVAALIHYLADTLWMFPPLAANFWFLVGISVMTGVIGTQHLEKESYTS